MIHERAQARRVALQGLYQLDVQGESFLTDGLLAFVSEATDDPEAREIHAYMGESAGLLRGTADEWLGKIAAKWPVYRMATVDRNILRLATWELINYPQTPAKAVVDEAINMGKEFSTADSGSFINGILDAVLKEHLAATGKELGAEGK